MGNDHSAELRKGRETPAPKRKYTISTGKEKTGSNTPSAIKFGQAAKETSPQPAKPRASAPSLSLKQTASAPKPKSKPSAQPALETPQLHPDIQFDEKPKPNFLILATEGVFALAAVGFATMVIKDLLPHL